VAPFLADNSELVQSQLKEAGISTTIRNLDAATNAATVQRWWSEGMGGEHMIYEIAAPSTTSSADLLARLHSNGSTNPYRLMDPELDQLIEAQMAELKDRQRRIGLIQQIQRRVLDVAAFVPVMVRNPIDAQWSYVKDWVPSGGEFYEYWGYQQVWL